MVGGESTTPGCMIIPSDTSLAMRIWIATKPFRFALGNMFTFYSDAFA
jgi:hypothetical protein